MFDWTCGSFLVDISCMCYIMYYICFNLFFILKHFAWTCLRWVVVSNMESLILKSSWENKLKWWTQISKHQVYQAGGVGQSTTWFDGRTSPTLRDSTKKKRAFYAYKKRPYLGHGFFIFCGNMSKSSSRCVRCILSKLEVKLGSNSNGELIGSGMETRNTWVNEWLNYPFFVMRGRSLVMSIIQVGLTHRWIPKQ